MNLTDRQTRSDHAAQRWAEDSTRVSAESIPDGVTIIRDDKAVDLNDIVRNIQEMLRRLIGEDVELRTDLSPDLGQVRAVPGQIEQVIVNLALNARDAMPSGGQLAIETANVELDEAYVREHPGSQMGPHVMLAVSDTGVGLDEHTLAHLFEPFLTTKGDDKDTGLGLAMVYGVVKQSGGYIWPCSQPGYGTTIRVYLPRVEQQAELAAPRPAAETVLVVEDEAIVRALICRVLRGLGYTVLTAAHPEKALAFCAQYDGPIDLLIADVMMPGMRGVDLAEQVAKSRPGISVLYISGYTEDVVSDQGETGTNWTFLPKPFTPTSLASKVQEALDKRK